MKIESFIKLKNGNLNVITENGNYEIANNADNGQPYGICLPGNDLFTTITKGIGRRFHTEIIKEIEKNNNIPVLQEHYFTPSESNKDFCGKCDKYFTHYANFRSSKPGGLLLL